MDIFKGQNLLDFSDRFKTDDNCKLYLSEIIFSAGFKCRKCGPTKNQIRENCSRICNRRSNIQSVTSNTLFHKVKFELRKPFFICFETLTSTKSLSASSMSVRYGVAENTPRLFMLKVRDARKSSERNSIDGDVCIDEFVVGGKETGKQRRSYSSNKKKTVCAVQLTEERKVKRFYALKTKDLFCKSLQTIFDKHSSKEAKVTTDEWGRYCPIAKNYHIEQSQKSVNFIALHTIIHQVKSWIRATHSRVSDRHINRYFDEFCFRINRSQSKESIFKNLIKKIVNADKTYHTQIVCN